MDEDFDYDAFMQEVEKCRNSALWPKYVAARSTEDAMAFAYWCIDNGIEEPEIIVFD